MKIGFHYNLMKLSQPTRGNWTMAWNGKKYTMLCLTCETRVDLKGIKMCKCDNP